MCCISIFFLFFFACFVFAFVYPFYFDDFFVFVCFSFHCSMVCRWILSHYYYRYIWCMAFDLLVATADFCCCCCSCFGRDEIEILIELVATFKESKDLFVVVVILCRFISNSCLNLTNFQIIPFAYAT